MKRWRATLTGDAAAYEADNKKMVDKIRSAVSLAVQLALAIALPGAGATFMSFVRITAMQIATSVASNVVIYGEDYSLDQLRGDIIGGVLGAAGGKLGEELVGGALAAKAALGAKEARAVAGEIADTIAKPVADATAKGAAKVGIGTTIAKEAASQVGSTAGMTLATGENQFTFQNFFEGALMSGATMVGKKLFGFDAPKPATEPRAPAGGGKREEPTAVAHPTEAETPIARTGDESGTVTEGQERRAPPAEVPHEPETTKPITSGEKLQASVEQSSHMDTVTDQQAANEVAYVNQHPEQFHVEGDEPNRRIPLKHGEHQIVETPGGCVRHSGIHPLKACPLFKAVEEAEQPEPPKQDVPALDRAGESRLRREVIEGVNNLGGNNQVRAEAQARRESAQQALDNFRQRANMRTGGDRAPVPDATQDHIRTTLVEIILDPVFGQLTLNELNAQITQEFPYAVRRRGREPSLPHEADRLRQLVDAANQRRMDRNNAQNAAEQAVQGQRAMTGISVGTGVVAGGTLEVTPVPGAAPQRLGGPMVGASPAARTAAPTDQPQRYWHRRADGSLNPEVQWGDHAERQVLASAAAQLEAQFPGVPRSSITGELKIHVEQLPCSNCVAGLEAHHTASGPLHQFSQEFPGVRIIVTFDGPSGPHLPGNPFFVQNGQFQ